MSTDLIAEIRSLCQLLWDCAILGLTPQATIDEIQAAFRRKARGCHPDHGGTDLAMAAVNDAYNG